MDDLGGIAVINRKKRIIGDSNEPSCASLTEILHFGGINGQSVRQLRSVQHNVVR